MRHLLAIIGLCFLGFALAFSRSGVGGKGGFGGKGGSGGGTTVSGEPVFTDIQGKWGTTVSSGTTFSVTLTSPPTNGNAVVCNVQYFPESMTITVLDGNSVSYTKSPASPSNVQSSAVAVSIFYLLNASGASATITATAAGGPITFGTVIGCEEFHRASGAWTFDTDISGNAASGGTVNTPSITSAVAGELEVGMVYAQDGFNANPCQSPWINSSMALTSGSNGATCYILSSSGSSTPMNLTINGSAGSWNSIAAAFK